MLNFCCTNVHLLQISLIVLFLELNRNIHLIMKYVFLVFVFIYTTASLFAQSSAESEDRSCYTLWAKAFEIRGSNEIKDGWYDGVVLSIRIGSRNDCYTAKVQVENGNIKDIFIKYVDGRYEPYLPKYKYEQNITIVNGISRTMQTINDELINIIFINHLLPKKQAYEKAPLPSLDDF